MAVAAEANLETQSWLVEDMFEGAGYICPPESEIYGRSLSTIRRLGACMTGGLASEIIISPEADQARAEFYTSVEEGFGTDLELGGGLEVRDFDRRPILDGRVKAKDRKTAVSEMTQAGLKCGAETASKDRRFLPQLIRSEWDHENALIVDKMARRETSYNTRIVISPFPEEAATLSGDAYWRNIGYVPHLKRGFVQIYHASEDGVTAGSLSFDGSDKERLREVFGRYGVDIPETEVTDNWLQYAITAKLSENDAKELALDIANQAGDPKYTKSTNTIDVTREYGSAMENVFNESYVHACESLVRGYQTPGARKLIYQLTDNAAHFNGRYAKALYEMRANEHKFTDDDMTVLHELLVYSTIEMMRALHLSRTEPVIGKPGTYLNTQVNVAYLQSLDIESFQSILSNFGASGAQNNRTYSACGLSISLGEVNGSNSAQKVFGGIESSASASTAGQDRFGPLKFQCKNGHWNERPKNKLITQCRVPYCKNSVGC